MVLWKTNKNENADKNYGWKVCKLPSQEEGKLHSLDSVWCILIMQNFMKVQQIRSYTLQAEEGANIKSY
jgi:hypothetical protein